MINNINYYFYELDLEGQELGTDHENVKEYEVPGGALTEST